MYLSKEYFKNVFSEGEGHDGRLPLTLSELKQSIEKCIFYKCVFSTQNIQSLLFKVNLSEGEVHDGRLAGLRSIF